MYQVSHLIEKHFLCCHIEKDNIGLMSFCSHDKCEPIVLKMINFLLYVLFELALLQNIFTLNWKTN